MRYEYRMKSGRTRRTIIDKFGFARLISWRDVTAKHTTNTNTLNCLYRKLAYDFKISFVHIANRERDRRANVYEYLLRARLTPSWFSSDSEHICTTHAPARYTSHRGYVMVSVCAWDCKQKRIPHIIAHCFVDTSRRARHNRSFVNRRI